MNHSLRLILTTILFLNGFHAQAETVAPVVEPDQLTDQAELNGLHFKSFGMQFIGRELSTEKTNKPVENIREALAYVQELITQEKIDPAKIVAIYDVDGVLSKDSQPVQGKKSIPREGSMETVTGMKALGVTIIASSAWSAPYETYNRLIELGYKDILDLKGKLAVSTMEKTGFQVIKTGFMASVKNEGVDKRYYRQKAFSPHAILNDKANNFTHVLFIDDSLLNFKLFQNDVLSPQGPYQKGTTIVYFLMSASR